MARRWVGSFAALLLIASRADAAPTSKLTYVRGPGAETCGDEPVLRSAVAQRIGYDPFFPWAERTVVAQIDKTSAGFRGQVRIIDAKGTLLGERSLDVQKDCSELVKSLALAISIALDDLDAAPPPPAEPPPPPPADPPPPPVTAEPERPPAREEPTPPPPLQPTSVFATGGMIGAIGSAPSPSIGVVIGVGVARAWWSAAIEGRADLPASSDIDNGAAVRTSILAASLVPCARASSFSFCAVGTIGSLSARAENVSTPRDGSAFYTALGGRAGVAIPIVHALDAYANAEIDVPLQPYRTAIDGDVVYSLSPVSAAFGVGLRLTPFW
jgi:hypothetical protein